MSNMKYQNLTIPISEDTEDLLLRTGFPRSKKINLFIFLKYLIFNPIMKKLASRIKSYEHLEERKRITLASYKLMEQVGEDPQDYESSYGYREFQELGCAFNYQKQIKDDFPNPSESKELYRYSVSLLTEIMKLENVTQMVDFGVSHAYLNSLVAEKFPQKHFIGTDRSKYTKLHNDNCFAEYPNMEFIAGDIFDLFSKRKFNGGVLFHARTMLLLPKAFVEKLYIAAAGAGFEYIVCMEQAGISRFTLEPYTYSDDDQPSVPYRDGMMIHNYPGILKKAGFTVIKSELVKTDHPHDDYRFISITAQRNNE